MGKWTPNLETLAGLDLPKLKNVRENAASKGNAEVVAFCDAELERRKPTAIPKQGKTSGFRRGLVVSGFHFVCAQSQNVDQNNDGTYWTGTWVVDQDHAERAVKIGAYVALHEAKAEPSYLQGIVKEWRRSPRQKQYAEGQEVKTETGIDFLLEPTRAPYAWQGDGSGEKGYFWKAVGE